MENYSQGRVRILAVDDERMIRDVYKEFLSSEIVEDAESSKIDLLAEKLFGKHIHEKRRPHYDTVVCRQGDEAIDEVRQSIENSDPFALAFIDIRMPPGPDGIVTAQKIREMDPYIEIVIVTGFSDYDPAYISEKVPPAHKLLYIQKPIYPHEISQFASSLSSKWIMEQQMRKIHQEMELKIQERTRELEIVNQQLLNDVEKRKSTENALRASEEKFKNIVQNISDFVCVHDMKGKILETNLNFKQNLGYMNDDFSNLYIQQLIPEKYHDKFLNYLKRITETGRDEGTMVIAAKDGRRLIVDYKNKLIQNSAGEPEVLGSGRDITEQLQTQKALKESEMLFRMLFENAGDAIFIIKTEEKELGKILAANQAAADMHGYTLGELMDLTIMDLDSEFYAEEAPQRIKKILNGEWIRDQIYHKRKDGTDFPIDMSAGPLELEGQKYILALERDITKQKEAEDRLSESEEKYRLLVDNAQDAVFILQDGYIRFANPSTLNILNYGLEDLLKTPFENMIYQDDRLMVINKLKKRAEGEAKQNLFSFRAVNKKNELLWFQITGVPVIWEERPSLLCFIRDITETKHLEKQLTQVQKMEALGTLAGGIAHDFNNILSVIMGNTQLLMSDLQGKEKGRDRLNRVFQATHRAKELVTQILTFSRLEDHDKKPVYIKLIVKETLKLLRASIPSNIEFKEDFQEKIGAILANPTQIHQVLLNLCTNAVHAMQETGGTLKIVLKNVDIDNSQNDIAPGSYVHLSVSDTGNGIEDRFMDKIFDPYFTTKKAGEGTGFGLSIVHGIVKSVDGHIKIQTAKGKGTTFDIYFPRVYPDAVNENEKKGLPAGGNEHILLVDDEETILETTGEMLCDFGYTVTLKNNGADALKAFQKEPDRYDFIITDLTMPQMGGKELALKIHGIKPDIPIVLCTGLMADIPENELKGTGIQAIIRKPVFEEELADIIRKLLKS